MSLTFTTDTLINSIKIRAQIPTNQVTFSEDDFIQLANEEMLIGIVPSVMQLHEDHYLFQEFTTLIGSVSEYEIPDRAIGNKLRDLSYVDTSGSVFEMVRIVVDDEPYFQRTTAQSSSSGLKYFYLRGNEVLLSPQITANISGSLKFSYYIRPNQLVKTDRAGLITAIDTTTGIVTVSSFPDNFTVNILYDLIKGKSPNKVIDYDLTPTAISSGSKTVTFDPDDLPSTLVVGDYLMQAGETILPNIPTELHPVLAQRVACRCLEALGDTQGLQNANAKLQEMEVRTGILVDNRVEGSPQKIINRQSFLRRSFTWRRF